MPIENIVGRAEIIFFSVGEGEAAWKVWRWPWVVRWDRIVLDRSMSRKAKSTSAATRSRAGSATRSPTKAILDRALTHISAASPKQGRGGSYQRLEFLGDHVLGLAISDMLYRAFPEGDEGELSRRLADLVRRESLRRRGARDRSRRSAAARQFGIECRRAAAHRDRSRDVCEALIGAVFVDGGYPAAAALIERLWHERMLAPVRAAARSEDDVAGMGAGTRPADAELPRGRADRAGPRSGISRRGRRRRACAGRRHRTIQARRRAGGRRRDAHARRRAMERRMG